MVDEGRSQSVAMGGSDQESTAQMINVGNGKFYSFWLGDEGVVGVVPVGEEEQGSGEGM